jgi:hypothetical protein
MATNKTATKKVTTMRTRQQEQDKEDLDIVEVRKQALADKREVLEAIDTRMAKIGQDHEVIINISTDMAEVKKELFIGNGHESVLTRITRAEERYEKVMNLSEGSGVKLDKLIDAVAKLDTSVQIHHQTMHINQWFKSFRFWAALLMGFIILHSIATYVPNLLNGIFAVLGVPIKIPLQ